MESTRFLFQGFELAPAQRELRRDGHRIEIQPRVFDLLHYLVRHRDRAVGKDELQDAVWPGQIVTETALTRAVMKARKAVGDDATAQSVIRTVHGHGYHFIAEVEECTSEAAEEADMPDMAVPARRGSRLPALLLVTLVTCIAAFGLWRAFLPDSPPQDLRIAVLPVDDRSGDPDLAWVRLGLMSYTSKALAADGAIPVVSDGNVAGISTALAWDGAADSLPGSDLAQGLQQAYGATHLLAMELSSEGAMRRMNYELLDSEGRVHRGTMVGRDPVQLANGVVQAVYGELLGRSRLAGGDDAISDDPFNNEAFARGMDLSLEGRCAEAIPFFRLVNEQEPGLFAPRLELAACLRLQGEPDEAEAILRQLIAEQERAENPGALGEALLVLAILQNRTGRLDEAQQNYLAAGRAADQAGDHDLGARVAHNLSILEKNRGNWEASADYLDRAAAAYRQAGREIMPGHLWSAYANLRMEQGALVEAGEFLERALTAFRATGERRYEAMMLNNFGYLRRMQGRLDEAEQYHLESLAIRSEIRDRVGVGRIHAMLSVLYAARGDYELARTSAEQALAVARETRDRLFEGTSLAQLAEAEYRLGMTGEARRHYGESKDTLAAIQDDMRVIQVELKLAEMELEEGRMGEAEAVAHASLERARELDHVQPEIEAMVLLADIEHARGNTDEALLDYRDALERVRETNLDALERSILVKSAGLLMDLGRVDECAPLVGSLGLLEADTDSLKTQARYAWLSGDAEQSAHYMLAARDLAAERWDDSDQELLQTYLGKP